MEEPAIPSGESGKQSVRCLLQVHDLTVGFRSRNGGNVVALEGVTFEIAAGEALLPARPVGLFAMLWALLKARLFGR